MPDVPGPDRFETTHWSLVLHASRREDTAAQVALETLCRRYWLPLYAYVRRRVESTQDAQDLTQEFFARLLEKQSLAAAAPERGRFRSFLLASMKNFLANEWDRTQAQKRGGGRERLSLDWEQGESQASLEPWHDLTPERLYERQWVLTLLRVVIDRLEQDYTAQGKERQFAWLKGTLTGESQIDYAAAAADLDLSEDAVRQAAHRLRKRYRDLLRAEVAQTVDDPADVEDELRGLFTALAE